MSKSNKLKGICVFCGANVGHDAKYRETAKVLGQALAERDVPLVFGGGHVGIMGVTADAALAAGGQVYGIIPSALEERELAHSKLTRLEVVRTMHERKKRMYDLSEAFIALPGGFGTLDEVFEIITWKQIGIHQKPVVFLNVDGYFDSLLQFVSRAMEEGFIHPDYKSLFKVASHPNEALLLINEFYAG